MITSGFHHTALGVETGEGLLRWKRRLTDLGWAVSGPYDRGYFTSLYFRAPDGQLLEIATDGPGFAPEAGGGPR
jgi:glyoxalase family protein